MRINITESKSGEMATAEDLQPAPTWSETFSASYKAMEATGLSTSKNNYRYDTFKNQIDELKTLDPDNSSKYENLLLDSYGNLKVYDMQYDQGGVERLSQYKSGEAAANYDLYRKKILEFNLKDNKAIEEE